MSPLKTALVLVLAFPPFRATADDSACDIVTLKDGQVVRGEIQESTARSLVMVARREWLRENLKDWPERWEKAERSVVSHALKVRLGRLESWRRDRRATAGAQDRITPWIDRELERLRDFDPATTPLTSFRVNRFDVAKLEKVGAEARGLLRLGWSSGFPNPEDMTIGDSKQALEGRGFDPGQPAHSSIESLLPPKSEPDFAWLTRRAATEVLHDPGLRFVRYQGMLLPDGGERAAAPTGIEVLGALRGLLGGEAVDPLPGKLREVESSGRVSVLLTQLEMAADLSMATVEVGMMVRVGPGRWTPAGSRVARARPEDVAPGAGEALGNDPRIASAFQIVEGLGLGEISHEMKSRGLGMGAATQKALGEARAASSQDLSRLAFPVLDVPPGVPRP